jgi:hypothetical protein
MLRILEIAAVITIVVYGIIKLIEMFSGLKLLRKEKTKGTALDELDEQAKEVAKKKEEILNETQKNKDIIDNINNTLN